MPDKSTFAEYLEKAQVDYRFRTLRSMELYNRSRRHMPGGDTRTAVFFLPYPSFIKSGQGYILRDVDGNQYIDHLNNYTVQIHGHNHPRIRAAAEAQLSRGTSFGAPHDKQAELAGILCQRFPSLEKLRFCNSGTEATMFSIRAARAHTAKSTIIKMEGIYHGTHDTVETSVFPSMDQAGDFNRPNPIPSTPGVPQGVRDHVKIAPFNNLAATKQIIEQNRDDLAAVIVEPVMTAAGVIPADPEYLEYLRGITRELGAVLIFDEVVTSRMSLGGVQEMVGITPDLTALGKYIGGGMPIGAFGGSAEIMDMFSPAGGCMSHSGTFNGHPVSMAAGVETLDMLDRTAFERLNKLGHSFRSMINEDVFGPLGVRAQAKGVGSISYIHYTDRPVNNYRDAKRAGEAVGDLPYLVHLGLLNHGIWIAERGNTLFPLPWINKQSNRPSKPSSKPLLKSCRCWSRILSF
jgi:glutamate-1-semialdehyde 2,1-aminomutase